MNIAKLVLFVLERGDESRLLNIKKRWSSFFRDAYLQAPFFSGLCCIISFKRIMVEVLIVVN